MDWQLFAVVAGFIAWAAVLIFVIYIDAEVGGWKSLAAKYRRPDNQIVHGNVLWPSTVKLSNGGSRYSGLLIVTATPTGLGLKMIYPF